MTSEWIVGNSEAMAEVALGPGKRRNRPFKVLELDFSGLPTHRELTALGVTGKSCIRTLPRASATPVSE